MSSLIRKLDTWSTEHIIDQWNHVASLRDNQLRSGKDISFESVLKPTISNLAKKADAFYVLDAGCGTGVLTESLANNFAQIVGVDMSAANIAIASSSASRQSNIRYVNDTVESYSTTVTDKFHLIIANMVLQDSPDLKGCLEAFASMCMAGTSLVATITHPWFWPAYWGYDKEPWFRYAEEQAIEAPFRISADNTPAGLTTHFHRPLFLYLNMLNDVGFILEELIEPMPSMEIQQKYPALWSYPRFLALRCSYQPKSTSR